MPRSTMNGKCEFTREAKFFGFSFFTKEKFAMPPIYQFQFPFELLVSRSNEGGKDDFC